MEREGLGSWPQEVIPLPQQGAVGVTLQHSKESPGPHLENTEFLSLPPRDSVSDGLEWGPGICTLTKPHMRTHSFGIHLKSIPLELLTKIEYLDKSAFSPNLYPWIGKVLSQSCSLRWLFITWVKQYSVTIIITIIEHRLHAMHCSKCSKFMDINSYYLSNNLW